MGWTNEIFRLFISECDLSEACDLLTSNNISIDLDDGNRVMLDSYDYEYATKLLLEADIDYDLI